MNLTEEQKQLLEDLKSNDTYCQIKAWQKISEDREFLVYTYRNDFTKSLSRLATTSTSRAFEVHAVYARISSENLLEKNLCDDCCQDFIKFINQVNYLVANNECPENIRINSLEYLRSVLEHPNIKDFISTSYSKNYRRRMLHPTIVEFLKIKEYPESFKEMIRATFKPKENFSDGKENG